MTRIEQATFSNESAHGVDAMEVVGESFRLDIQPWERPDLLTGIVFDRVRMTSVDRSYADDPGQLPPWDIVGFDSDSIGVDRWSYVLHTDVVEYGFEAAWPVVTGSALAGVMPAESEP